MGVARLSVGMRSTPSAQPEDADEALAGKRRSSVVGLPAVTTHRKVKDVLAETQKHLKGGSGSCKEQPELHRSL